MTFSVETFINPNELMNPDLLTDMLTNSQYTTLLSTLSAAYQSESPLGPADTSTTRLNLKTNINTTILNLFNAYTTLAADAPRLSTNLTNIQEQLNTLKINNTALKEELAQMYELSDGSSELINDYKQLYNINYTRNWGIFLSIIFSCYVMSVMFKSKPITL
jgi:hypothetical protein